MDLIPFFFVVPALFLLDLLATRFGYDSRDRIDGPHQAALGSSGWLRGERGTGTAPDDRSGRRETTKGIP